MSLFKQIQLLITLLLLATLAIVIKINFEDARQFTANQLYNNSKNTANVLALSLSPKMTDIALVETTINAMFDGGYFEEISLVGSNGNIIYKRHQPVKLDNVPKFFINLVKLEPPIAKAQIINGWSLFGELKVKGHTGDSYFKLWVMFKEFCLVFLFLGGISIFTAHLILKYILKSLVNIQKQAEAITRNEFIINPDTPKAPELNKVVIAMNAMVEKVKTIFERQLRQIQEYNNFNFKDPDTELYNRKYMVDQFSSYICNENQTSMGRFILIKISGLKDFSISLNNSEIMPFFHKLKDIFENSTSGIENSIETRMKSNEFSIVLPGADDDLAITTAKTILGEIKKLMAANLDNPDSIKIFIGITTYNYKDKIQEILSKADYALSVAESGEDDAIEVYKENSSHNVLGKFEWKKIIEEAIANNRFKMTAQPVMADNEELHKEIYIGLVDKNGERFNAGYFMPMVISLGMADKLDKYVLESSAKHIMTSQNEIFAVNITSEFCKDRMAFLWLRKFLSTNRQLRKNLFFEFQETTIVKLTEITKDISGLLKGMGYRFGIDHFTMQEEALNLISEIRPDYIKIEASNIIDEQNQASKDIALNALITITDSLGIKLIATRIENMEEKEILKNKGIKFFQGRGIAKTIPVGE